MLLNDHRMTAAAVLHGVFPNCDYLTKRRKELHKSATLSLKWSQMGNPDRPPPLSLYAFGTLWQSLLRLGLIMRAETARSESSQY